MLLAVDSNALADASLEVAIQALDGHRITFAVRLADLIHTTLSLDCELLWGEEREREDRHALEE